MKNQEEFIIITKSKHLVKHTFMMTNEKRFPKKFRFTLVNRLNNISIEIFENILEANELSTKDIQESKERKSRQKKALTLCKMMLFLVELSFENKLISEKQCEKWTKHVLDVKFLTAKWIKGN